VPTKIVSPRLPFSTAWQKETGNLDVVLTYMSLGNLLLRGRDCDRTQSIVEAEISYSKRLP
jgi:hypothetical protein